MIIAVIVACEVGFWVLLTAALASRYMLHRERLSNVLLVSLVLLNVPLFVAAVIDMRGGAEASLAHALAAVYIGTSVAFGRQMIDWADVRFAHRFAGGPPPEPKVKRGPEHARNQRAQWLRHLLAWAIGCVFLLGGVLLVGDRERAGALINVALFWTALLGIDFIISFSYTLLPRRSITMLHHVRGGIYASARLAEARADTSRDAPPAGAEQAMSLRTDIGEIWDREIVSAGKRNRVLVLTSFLATFILVRLITYTIKDQWLPLKNIKTGDGLHIHHLVFGIIILLWTGYVAIEFDEHRLRAYLAVTYGIGAALTLDEFALWLNLKDVYWAKQGRESVDAVVIVAVTLTLVWLGLGFWRAIGRMLLRMARDTERHA